MVFDKVLVNITTSWSYYTATITLKAKHVKVDLIGCLSGLDVCCGNDCVQSI